MASPLHVVLQWGQKTGASPYALPPLRFEWPLFVRAIAKVSPWHGVLEIWGFSYIAPLKTLVSFIFLAAAAFPQVLVFEAYLAVGFLEPAEFCIRVGNLVAPISSSPSNPPGAVLQRAKINAWHSKLGMLLCVWSGCWFCEVSYLRLSGSEVTAPPSKQKAEIFLWGVNVQLRT